MEKKYYDVVKEMSDETLQQFIKSFLARRFGKSAVEDKAYRETWFKRFREDDKYVGYMDAKSRAIFFTMISGVKNQ